MPGLTTAAIERLKPPAAGQADHFDKGYPGLALRCSYKGAKTFVHVYRFNGKLHRATLGRFPAMSLADAREAWRRGREAIERGDNPAKQKAANPDTFAAVAAEWLKRDQATNRSAADVARRIAREATPLWGERLITAITRRDVIELIDEVVDRGHPIAARRLHAHLHRLFRWAVGRGILDRNPMTDLPKVGQEVRRDRVLSEVEIAAIWQACAALGAAEEDGFPTGWPFGPALRLLLLTGARKEEICSLRWSEIVGDAINLPRERTKNGEARTIPLSTPAQRLIASLPHIGESAFVFTTTGRSSISGWSKAKRTVDEKIAEELAGATAAGGETDQQPASPVPMEGGEDEAAGTKPWRIHDIRRTVATGLQRLGVSLQVIEAVLGHISGSRAGIVGVYQRHAFEPEKQHALAQWADELMRIVSKGPPAESDAAVGMSNVVVLPAARGQRHA